MARKSRSQREIKISAHVWKAARLTRRSSSFDRRMYIFPKSWSQNAVDVVASRYLKTNGGERSIQSMISRVVESIGREGLRSKVFKSGQEAQEFIDQLAEDILQQRCSFNSPVWFNVGLETLNLPSSDVSGYRWNPKSQKSEIVPVSKYPQVSACFIQSLDDDLMSIFDLIKNEARVFKFGSGTGTNFSKLRAKGRPLAGGGTTSGLISFLEVFDKAAGAVKSGGTTRRAAKMVLVDADHPDVLDFIGWKAREEKKAKALISAGYSDDMEGEAYHTVSGQNANHSIRLNKKFMKSVFQANHSAKNQHARSVLNAMAQSAWECGDPGVQFHDTIQRWHTCPKSGPITASNPCSEYMFLDDSACNLSSINWVPFVNATATEITLDFDSLGKTIERLITAQEILVGMASYPTAKIAQNSAKFRPLGLGFSNLGGLLMRLGIGYGSQEARDLAAGLMSLMQALAVQVSARLARQLKPYSEFGANRGSHLKVLAMHKLAHRKLSQSVTRRFLGLSKGDSKNFTTENEKLNAPSRVTLVRSLTAQLLTRGNQHWSDAMRVAEKYGQRHAQLTAIAPTGTISFMMDCGTTGVEPEFSLVKTKRLVGGQSLRMVSPDAEVALVNLGYSKKERDLILSDILSGHSAGEHPLIRAEDRNVFQTAQGSANQALNPMDHVLMMAALQPFVSGAISKTVNLPTSAQPAEIERIYMKAWELGIKSIAVYRDQSKVSQPLTQLESKGTKEVSGAPLRPCPECRSELELHSGCWTCPVCGLASSCG